MPADDPETKPHYRSLLSAHLEPGAIPAGEGFDVFNPAHLARVVFDHKPGRAGGRPDGPPVVGDIHILADQTGIPDPRRWAAVIDAMARFHLFTCEILRPLSPDDPAFFDAIDDKCLEVLGFIRGRLRVRGVIDRFTAEYGAAPVPASD